MPSVSNQCSNPYIDLEMLRQQIEYYFCDKNLSRDAFFHSKMSKDPEGWLNARWIMSCPNIKRMWIQRKDIVAALEDSHLITKQSGKKVWIRRKKPLPALIE